MPREDVFVTTKLLPPRAPVMGRSAESLLEASLRRLGLDHVDLYLIHWPNRWAKGQWKALAKAQERGLARAIGVSNYGVSQLQELLDWKSARPAVNQVNFNPFTYRRALREFCEQRGMVLEAYASLTQSHRIDDPTVARIAAEHDRTPAQVLLRWAVQRDVVVDPEVAARGAHPRERAHLRLRAVGHGHGRARRARRDRRHGGGALMRVIEVTEFGGPEALHVVERADPVAAPGQVLVRVRAANVNPTDLSVRDGSVVRRAPSVAPPVVPGWDLAGEVAAVGDGVTGLSRAPGWSDDPLAVDTRGGRGLLRARRARRGPGRRHAATGSTTRRPRRSRSTP